MKHGPLLSTGNLTIALIWLLAGAVRAENWARYAALPGSKVRIEGTSTTSAAKRPVSRAVCRAF